MTFNVDKKMPIAMAKGNMMNIRLSCADMSFRDFGKFCNKPQKGGKHEAYFIRGVPITEEKYISGTGHEYYNGKFRHDDSLWKADFLIIDADNCKSSPEEVGAVLKNMKAVFFLYTTHSHTNNKNNFRIVIPCLIDSKAKMVPTAQRIIRDLQKEGLKIEYTREMGVWSQCWYLPTRDNPNDGLFRYYENMTGETYVQSKEIQPNQNGRNNVEKDGSNRENKTGESYVQSANEKERLGKNSDNGDNRSVNDDSPNSNSRTLGDNDPDSRDSNMVRGKQSVDELIKIMRIYGEGCHNAMLKYSHMMAMDGVAKKTVIATMQAIMESGKNTDKRTLKRYEEIERIVRDKEGINAEIIPLRFGEPQEISAASKAKMDEEIKWPPGMMAELCQSAYEYSLYPDRTIALVASLGLMAGVAGRRFNIGGSGLNLYLTLLMDTGGGKSIIGKFIRKVLNDSNIFISGDIFIGSGNYTGPKALMDDLRKKRCMVSVFTEAGFMFRSRAGDKDGLTRALLDLYGCSGHGCFSSGANYSSDKNHIPALASPCFSLVNESTPDVFLKALKDGARTGEINRMNIFRLEDPCCLINRNQRFYVAPEILEKVKSLMTRASKTQTENDPDITNFEITPEMNDFADKVKQSALGYREDNYIKFSMMQRSAEKTFKLAALITVLNIDPSKHKHSRTLSIGAQEWEWAVGMYEHEMMGLETFFVTSDNEEMFSVISNVMYKIVYKLLNCKYKDRRLQPTPVERKANRFPLIMLRRALKNCKRVTDLRNPHRNKDGIDIVMEYLENEGYIRVIKSKPDMKKHVLVNQSFLELGDG